MSAMISCMFQMISICPVIGRSVCSATSSAFKSFLDHKDKAKFDEICSLLAQEFQQISVGVISLEKQLKELDLQFVADRLRRVQILEKSHLELVSLIEYMVAAEVFQLTIFLVFQTIQMQVWQAKYIVEDEDEHNPRFVEAVRNQRKELVQIRESINQELTSIDDALNSGIEAE